MSGVAIGDCPYVSWKNYAWRGDASAYACNLSTWNVHIPWNPAVYCLVASFHALAWWISLTLIAQTWLKFRKRTTLYFWSMQMVAFGIILETFSFNGHLFYNPAATHAGMILYSCLNLPATIMIRTGFGLVLCSRLHLLKPDLWFRRSILIMVIVLGFVEFGGNVAWMTRGYKHGENFHGRSLFDIWITVDILFPLQDIFLSSLYLYYFWDYLNDMPGEVDKELQNKCRRIFALLLAAFIWVSATDVSMYALQLTKWYLVRMMLLPFLEAIKLKLEFVVLNQLLEASEMKRKMLQDGEFGGLHIVEVDLSTSGTEMINTVLNEPMPVALNAKMHKQRDETGDSYNEQEVV